MSDFFYGFLFCMVCDVIFSFCKYFVERAFYFRNKNRHFKELWSEKMELIDLPFWNADTGRYEVCARGSLEVVFASTDYQVAKSYIEKIMED